MNQSAKSYLERVQVLANRVRTQRTDRSGAAGAGLPIEEIRMDLYAAIDRVLAKQSSNATIEQLRPQIHTAVDTALGAGTPGLESADHKLAQVVQSVFGGKSGETAGSAAGAAPRLIRQVTPILLQFANDDKRLAQLEKHLVKLLSARMGPQTAARVAGAAVTAVRAMARNAGKK